MKKIIKIFLAYLLTLILVLLLWVTPGLALPDNMDVLASLYLGTNQGIKSGFTFTLTLPYSDSRTEVAFADLTPAWVDGYTIVSNPFSGTESIAVGGSAPVVVQYENPENEMPCSTTYSVSVTKENPPTLTGANTKTVAVDATLNFSAADFIYSPNDGTLSKIKITENSAQGGVFKNNTNTYLFGNIVNVGTLSFTASSSGTYTYNITAYDSNEISFDGTAILTITVSNVTATAPDVTVLVGKNAPRTIPLATFDSVCQTATGKARQSIAFETLPVASGGVLRYNSTTTSPVATGTIYNRTGTAQLLSGIYFVPATSTYSGTVSATYKGINVDNVPFTGRINFTVKDASEISYTTAQSTAKKLTLSDFESVCIATVGGTLDYIQFESFPNASTQGKLYYNYASASSLGTQITSNATKCYRITTAPLLSTVAFVPVSTFTTSVTVSYTGFNTDGASFHGNLTFTVSSVASDITYTTIAGTAKAFTLSNFTSACSSTVGGTLNYIKFNNVPTSSQGALRYNYVSSSNTGTAVSVSTQLYNASRGTPLLSTVYFVPNSSYTGTITLAYTGYNTNGASFTGQVKITVTDAISYSTDENTPVKFTTSKFNTAFTSSGIGGTFSYVTFTLPSSSYGTLYYNYNTSTGSGTKVTSSTKCYYSGSTTPLLSNITFVPYSNYSGTVTINYTGYNTNGSSFSGQVEITVDDTTNIISYSTNEDTPVNFTASKFNTAFTSSGIGGTSSYVTFTLPSSSYGTLYYGYNSSTDVGTKLTSSTKCYYSGTAPLLSNITFVPYSNYSGTVTINYTGYNTSGSSFPGQVKITVEGSVMSIFNFIEVDNYVSDQFSDVDENAWYGFNRQKVIVSAFEYGLMKGTSGTKFNPTGNFTVGEAITVAARVHSIYMTSEEDFIQGNPWYQVYVDYAITNGIIAADDFTNYTRAATRAEMAYIFSCALPQAEFEEQNTVYSLPDVDSGTSYHSSIILLYEAGVLTGTDAQGTFKPGNSISRAEAAAIISRVILPDTRVAGMTY